jgi:hypothetical protein
VAGKSLFYILSLEEDDADVSGGAVQLVSPPGFLPVHCQDGIIGAVQVFLFEQL